MSVEEQLPAYSDELSEDPPEPLLFELLTDDPQNPSEYTFIQPDRIPDDTHWLTTDRTVSLEAMR